MTDHLPAWSGDVGLAEHLRTIGSVFREFRNQDSGFVSYGIEIDGRQWFVKHSAAGPLRSLHRATCFHHAVRHRSIVPLRQVLRADEELALVYPWVAGEVLYGPATARGSLARTDPASAHARFRAQPVGVILDVFEEILDAHLSVSRAGFVAADWYDGCLVYDFAQRRINLIDLDEYRPGPFVVEGAPLPGSTRFRPPEHCRNGTSSDDRSTVFQLGRTAQVLLDAGDLTGTWRAAPDLADVARIATAEDPDARYQSVAELVHAWRETCANGSSAKA